MQVAKRVESTKKSLVHEMKRIGKELEAKGIQIARLGQGEPDFRTLEPIVRAAHRALDEGFTYYTEPKGIPELRRAVAEKLSRKNNLNVDPDSEVIITTGATEGLYIAIFSLLNPGDEVILFEPGFVGVYSNIVNQVGCKPIFVSRRMKNHLVLIDWDLLEKSVSSSTKAIIIDSPTNPTGSVFSQDQLSKLVSFAEKHNLLILSDEIYEYITYGGKKHISIASISKEARKRTVSIYSMSKTYAMTGWRLGYNVAPKNLTKGMLSMHRLSARCATAFVQKAGITALSADTEPYIYKMVEEYGQRRKIVLNKLKEIPNIDYYAIEGTFYAFVNLKEYDVDSLRMSKRLLTEGHVVTVPGKHYGPSGESFIRISFACSQEELTRGLEGISKVLQNIRKEC